MILVLIGSVSTQAGEVIYEFSFVEKEQGSIKFLR